MELSAVECLFHSFSFVYIWSIDPLLNPEKKRHVDILAGLGVVICSFGLFFKSSKYYFSAILLWILAFAIHTQKLLGDYSPIWFHVLLAGPQYCIMAGVNTSPRKSVKASNWLESPL